MGVEWSRRVAMVVMLAVPGFGGLVVAGCSTPTDPTPPIQVTCPASKTVESLTGDPVSVDFQAATSAGGAQPVAITCTAQSGSNFPVGTTNVICTARDARQLTASCGLNVTVTAVGVLSDVRFLAFGDSITAGSLSPCNSTPSVFPLTRASWLRDLRVIQAAINVPTSYPSVLTGLLRSRYVTQSPVVINEGAGGEEIVDETGGTMDATLNRLRQKLQEHSPNILLLQEGVNDLNLNPQHPEVEGPRVVKALHDMIDIARGRGVRVFLGTLVPQQRDACRGYAPDSIAPTNELIRAQAAADGAVLVDLYEAFGGVAGPYIGVDGLHPNELGYQKIAETFLDGIKKTLEVPR